MPLGGADNEIITQIRGDDKENIGFYLLGIKKPLLRGAREGQMESDCLMITHYG